MRALRARVSTGPHKSLAVQRDTATTQPFGGGLGADEQEEVTDTPFSLFAGRVSFPAHASEAGRRKSLDGKDGDGKTPFDLLEKDGYRARRFAMSMASGEGDPEKVVASWLKEPADRDALLSKFDRVGVGVATDSEGIPYWVLLLAQTVGR